MAAMKEALAMLEDFDIYTQGWVEFADGLTRRLNLEGEYHTVHVTRSPDGMRYVWTDYKDGEPAAPSYITGILGLLSMLDANGLGKYISDYGQKLIGDERCSS